MNKSLCSSSVFRSNESAHPVGPQDIRHLEDMTRSVAQFIMIGFFLILFVLLNQAHSSFLTCSMSPHNEGCFSGIPAGRISHLGHPELINTRRIFLRNGPFTKFPFKTGFGSVGTIRFWRRDSGCATRCSSEVPTACPSKDAQICIDDINECRFRPCQHNGTCLNFDGGYNCTCVTGWQGRNCEEDVDECLSTPCQNGGTCQNFDGGYNCSCPIGWGGENCETDVDECRDSPCQHNGTCQNFKGGYNCTCPIGWDGQNCETDVDECIYRPCQNDGTCQNFEGGYNCSCLTGWEGRNCNERESKPEDDVSLRCMANTFLVKIPGKLLTDQSNIIHLWDSDCVGRRLSNGDVVVESRYDGCGTIQEVDEGGNKIIYRNIVTDVTASSPSFLGQVEIEVACFFDEDTLVSTNYTLRSNLRRSLSQTGEYDVSFFFCTDDTFSEVQETPLFVERTKKIFLKAQLETQVSGLNMFGTRCWATPSVRSDDDTFTNLIQNGCPVAGRHVEIKSDVSPTSRPSFAFSALAAQPDLHSNVVYVHCKIRICEEAHADACRPCCSGPCRQRRSNGLMLSHRLSQGPIIQEVPEHPGEITWPLPAVVFLCVLSVLSVCGLAFVSVVLGFRRNSAKSTAADGYSQF